MTKKVKILTTFILGFHLMALNCLALNPGSTGAVFLKLGLGSKPISMGEAYTAVSGDINSLYWNPAGTAGIEDRQLSFAHSEWFQSIRYEHLAYCQPAFGGVIGASITYLWVDGVEKRGYADFTGATIEGYVPARDLAIGFSYALPGTESLDFGATVKILHQQLEDNIAMGIGLDIGFQYTRKDDRNSTIGVSIQNLGWESAFVKEAFPLPLNIKAGISEKYLPDESGRYTITLALDTNYGIIDNVWSINFGCEYWLHPVFAIRGGFKYNNATFSLGSLSGLTCGLGFCLNTFSIDYALVPYGVLGITHRISLMARF